MDAFWLSLWLVFLAELGDKTQLVAMTLAARYRPRLVLAGIFAATLVVHLVSVGLGGLAGQLLPTNWIKFLAGLAFIAFGFWTLRGDTLEDGETQNNRIRSPFWLIFVTFFLAELGDKTMLSTVTIAATHTPLWVWLGSSLGMVVSDGLAIGVGAILGTRLPERLVKTVAAIIFFAFGLHSALTGGLRLPPQTLYLGAGAVCLMALFFLRGGKSRK